MNYSVMSATKREKEKQNLLRELDSYLLDHTSASQASRIYHVVYRNTEKLYTKEDFIKYFIDDSVYVYGLGKQSLALVRDFLGIKKTVTLKRDDKLDKTIYNDYLSGTKVTDLCIKYQLQNTVVMEIINKYASVYLERQNYMYDMHEYLYHRIDKFDIANKTLKALNKYITENYNLGIDFSKKDLIDLINSDTKITGIRKTVRDKLREFVSMQ